MPRKEHDVYQWIETEHRNALEVIADRQQGEAHHDTIIQCHTVHKGSDGKGVLFHQNIHHHNTGGK